MVHAFARRVPESARSLEQAIKAGYPLTFAQGDPDLEQLWREPAFAALARAHAKPSRQALTRSTTPPSHASRQHAHETRRE